MTCTHSTGGCGCSHDHEPTPAPGSAVPEAPAAEHGCCGGGPSERPTVDAGPRQER